MFLREPVVGAMNVFLSPPWRAPAGLRGEALLQAVFHAEREHVSRVVVLVAAARLDIDPSILVVVREVECLEREFELSFNM
jgi:hypothetical protein